MTPYTWAEKFESFERINSIRETNGNFNSCNSCKRLVSSRLHELHESKFPFVSRIEFIRSKLSDFSAHVSGVNERDAPPRPGREGEGSPARLSAGWRDWVGWDRGLSRLVGVVVGSVVGESLNAHRPEKEHAAKLLTAHYVLITPCYHRAGLRSRSRSELAIFAGVGVGVEVDEFSPTPTPARIASESIGCVSRMPFCYERQRQSLSEKQFWRFCLIFMSLPHPPFNHYSVNKFPYKGVMIIMTSSCFIKTDWIMQL